MNRYLIDQVGEAMSAYDDRLAEKLGYAMPDFDLTSYAVRNLGAVDLEIRGNEVSIRFRRTPVSEAALATIIRLLNPVAIARVTVNHVSETWSEKAFATLDAAIEWIASGSAAAAGVIGQNLMTVPRKLEALMNRRLSRIEDSEDKLALIFKKWRIAQGLFTAEATSFLVRFSLLDRTSVVSEAANSGELVIEHAAPGFMTYDNFDPSWSLAASGRPVADQPDPQFGRWINDTYREVLDRKEPRFEHVDAVIQAQGADPYRFRYNRLLLPWHSPDGTRVITGTSYNEFAGPFA